MGWLSENPLYDAFAQRALLQVTAGGADFGECLTTMSRIGNGGVDRWYDEWKATADRVAAQAEASAARNHRVSARDGFLRASTYYHAAYFPLFGAPADRRLVEAFDQEAGAFRRAAELAAPPVELVEIPFEGGTLPAFFAPVDETGRPRPTLVQTNGYDSTLQEMYFSHVPAATRRGYNVLGFDGPGQGRNLIHQGMPIRPDWEHVVAPVVDYAVSRPDIADDKVVLVGWSFGGFLAPRAAAFEHRIAALVADPGQWDQRDAMIPVLPLSDEAKRRFPDVDPAELQPLEDRLRSPDADPMARWRLLQRGLWVHGVDTLYEYLVALLDFQLSPVASRISCPTLLTAAEGDPIAAGAPTLYDALTVPRRELVRFSAAEGAGGHCEGLARSLYHQRVFDWLDETLGHDGR